MFACSIDVLSACLVFVVMLIVPYFIFFKKSRCIGLPPGPTPCPVFGNVLQLAGKDLRLVFNEYRQRYGNIFTVRMYNTVVIVVNGYEDIKEVFVKNGSTFSDRPQFPHIGPKAIFKGHGVLYSSGEIWKHNRRFAIHTLRDFGMGKRKLQNKIQDEISHFLDAIEKYHGHPFDLRQLLSYAVSNVICSIVFGTRFEYGDEELKELKRRIDESVKESIFFLKHHWLKYIPGDPFGVAKWDESYKFFVNFYKTKIREHMRTFDENRTRDLIDAYLKKANAETTEDKASLMNEDELIRTVHDIFVAGSETTTTALSFCFIYLTRDPDIQAKIFGEIHDELSAHTAADMDDKKHLPFTDATILETLRRASILPFSLPHVTSGDLEYRGYNIPRSAIIMPCLESVLMDEKLWDDPIRFNPARFLNEDNSVLKTEELIPFSIGPRLCAGESMARMEMFLFLTAMIQRFEFLPPEGENAPDAEGISGIVVTPKPFKVRAIKRVN